MIKKDRPLLTSSLLAACSIFANMVATAQDLAPVPCPQITASLQPLVDSHILGGAVMLVATKDRVLCLDAVGWSDLETRKPMRTDNLFWLASISKTFDQLDSLRRMPAAE
jgi:CubicO group peptidase (beta-lactamase class C family)